MAGTRVEMGCEASLTNTKFYVDLDLGLDLGMGLGASTLPLTHRSPLSRCSHFQYRLPHPCRATLHIGASISLRLRCRLGPPLQSDNRPTLHIPGSDHSPRLCVPGYDHIPTLCIPGHGAVESVHASLAVTPMGKNPRVEHRVCYPTIHHSPFNPYIMQL